MLRTRWWAGLLLLSAEAALAGLASDSVRSVLAASAGDLWIATDSPNRVQRLREGRFYDYEMPQPSRSIRAMAEDAAGSVWFGTSDGQLWRVSDPVLVSEPAAIQDRPMSIRCLHATADGSLWIGYAGWGVGRLKAGRLTRVETAHGLSETHISQILADDRGWLWFAGNRGIFQVRRQDLADAMEGRTDRVRSIVYGRGEGVPNLQANYGHSPAALRSRDGRLWFSMRTGLAVAHADKIRDNLDPPPVLLEGVSVDGQTITRYDSRSPLRGPTATDSADLRSPTVALRLRPDHRKLDLDEIVWAVKPRNDTLAHLIDYAGQFALDYLRVAGIRCRVDFPEPTPDREISTDVRHNLFLVVKEALHNTVKHAQASEVWLRVSTSEHALRVVIEDNGRGFDRPPEDARADGLRNIRQRVAELGGECRIESSPGAGTKIAVELPWGLG